MEVTRINHEATINRQLPTFYLCYNLKKKKMFTPERGPSSLGFLTRSPGWHLRRPGSLQSPPKAAPPLVNAGHDTVEKGVRQKQYSDVDALAMRLNIDINMIHISIFTVFYSYFWCRGWCLSV